MESLDQVESELNLASIPLPHQIEAVPHPTDSPDFLPSKKLHMARKTALASLGSLANLLKNPAERLMETCLAVSTFHLESKARVPTMEVRLTVKALRFLQDQRAAALALTTSTSIPTLLSRVGPAGMSSSELSCATRIQEEKLVKVMRYLSHNQIFNEVSERVFSHNRTSLYLMPNHPVRDFVSFAHWSSINGTKCFQEVLMSEDPKIRYSLQQLETPTSVGLDLKNKENCEDVWDYLEKYDTERLSEFASSMGAYDYLGKAGELVGEYECRPSQLPFRS